MELISGVVLKKLIRHNDERGFFEELIRVNDDFFQEGFGQWSRSHKKQGVVVAWHFHPTQVDWWYVAFGTLKVALYDIRKRSVTFKQINEFILGENGKNVILKIPSGVAHGFRVVKGPAELFYLTSKIYNPEEEGRLPPNDPKINYDWDT